MLASTKKYPALIIIPHGGYKLPDELTDYSNLGRFDLFYSSDSCANELFSYEDRVTARIATHISRLFIDPDRSPLELPPATHDGVIKKQTSDGKSIYNEGIFPDEIAISNMIKRYYVPFHQSIERIIKTNKIRIIIDCHTMMAVGSKTSLDPGCPRPIITIGNRCIDGGETVKTSPDETAAAMLEYLTKSMDDEKATVAERFSLNKPPFQGHIMKQYGTGGIPLLRLSLSRALFFNEKYFNYDYIKVDDIRISQLKEKLWKGLERFFKKAL
jgi:N-formylglutamate deformylase